MKRIISLLLIFAMLFSFSACNKKVDEPVTIYVGLGNTGVYYDKLKALIEEKLGYEVELVFNNTMDTTNALVQMCSNDDLPADIVISASQMPDSVQKDAFLDLNAYTQLTNNLPSTQVSQVAIGGSVYQLPLSSRLIGIEYNETLFNELGWSIPTCFSEMVALKEKADAAGIKFAVSGGYATGHGFNYLFHLMGSQYLNAASGTEWFNDFLSGDASVDAFKSASSYFQKYKEAGLFGTYHDSTWDASTEFKETRALFYYNIINDAYSYDGYQYDDDGKIVGATYNGNDIVVEKADDGDAVCVDGKYVLYDETNEAHKGLQRYNIPGAKILHDTYGSMPWVAENGVGNYTIYNNMYVSLNDDLLGKENEEKLEKCIDIIELMMGDDAVQNFLDLYEDGIVYLKSSTIDESRLYYEYKDVINRGGVQPWYYNEFDVEIIDHVGEVVNSYLSGTPGKKTFTDIKTFDDIFTELTLRRDEYLKNTVEYCATLNETLEIEDVAKLECIANGLSAQDALESINSKSEVTVSLLPYTDDISKLSNKDKAGVVQMKMYRGKIETTLLNCYVQILTSAPLIIYMSGADINDLVEKGYNTSELLGVDQTFPIKMVTKNNIEVYDGSSYYVAVPKEALGSELYKKYTNLGLVIKSYEMDNDGNFTDLTGNTITGLKTFFAKNVKVSKASLEWK